VAIQLAGCFVIILEVVIMAQIRIGALTPVTVKVRLSQEDDDVTRATQSS
jgi:hypothetical protein